MGSNNGNIDERPAHTVHISSFKMNKYEVTFSQYDSCVQSGHCTKAHYDDKKCLMWTSKGPVKVKVPQKYRKPDYPVICVTWRQAKSYCRFKGMRLPTEAEWEYSALANKKSKYSWGNESPNGRCTNSSKRHPAPVGSYAPNNFGLYDMTGNVWEWTSDRYLKDQYKYAKSDNPSGPPVGRYRSIRGGGWYSTLTQLRVKNRQWFAPEWGEASLGIRCVK